MSDLHLSPYTDRIIEVSGADHREALIVETALRWGLGEGRERGNPGTLDHLDAREFDRQVREVVRLFSARPSEREAIEREAAAERLIPRAPRAGGAPGAGDRVRVWFTGNGVVVEAPDDPWTRPYAIRLDGADADSYHQADQVRREVSYERRPAMKPRKDTGGWSSGTEDGRPPRRRRRPRRSSSGRSPNGGDGDRGEFRIVPNEPPPEDLTGRAT